MAVDVRRVDCILRENERPVDLGETTPDSVHEIDQIELLKISIFLFNLDKRIKINTYIYLKKNLQILLNYPTRKSKTVPVDHSCVSSFSQGKSRKMMREALLISQDQFSQVSQSSFFFRFITDDYLSDADILK